MSYVVATLFAATAIVAVVLSAGSGRDANAQRSAAYQIAAQSGTRDVWLVNTVTGRLRLCHPPRTVKARPSCGNWSK